MFKTVAPSDVPRTRCDLPGTSGDPSNRDQLGANLEKFPPQEHPVVRTHPETGGKILYVGAQERLMDRVTICGNRPF